MTLVETTRLLIDTPSVTGEETAVRDLLAARLDPVVPTVKVGRSLVAGAPGGKPLILLVGHLDTVPPQGQGPARVEGGRIHGLGSADMKGGVAVIAHLVAELASARSDVDRPFDVDRPSDVDRPFDVVGVFYAGEEGPFAANELETVLDEVPWLAEAAFAVVLEPSDGAIQLGCTGVVNARVSFLGKAAHSARPWLGDNAVTKAGVWLAAMHSRPPRPRIVGGLEFVEVMSVTMAAGGVARNVVPARFDLNLNYRFAPDRSVDEAVAELEEACRPADEVAVLDVAPAGPVDVSHPLLGALQRASGAAVAPKQGWTDVARLTARGVPAVNYGPGETSLAHGPDESLAVADLERCHAVLRSVLSGAARSIETS